MMFMNYGDLTLLDSSIGYFVYNLAGSTFAVSVYKISVDVTSILSILGSS